MILSFRYFCIARILYLIPRATSALLDAVVHRGRCRFNSCCLRVARVLQVYNDIEYRNADDEQPAEPRIAGEGSDPAEAVAARLRPEQMPLPFVAGEPAGREH